MKPKLDNHEVMCINCGSTYPENRIILKSAGRMDDGRVMCNDECPTCGAYNSHCDVNGRSDQELREKQHEIARQRHEARKQQQRANELVDVECSKCGDTYEVERRYKHNHIDGDGTCDECRRRAMIEQLRDCLDPDHDGTFSRPNALERLKHEYNQMPIVDYDGSLIVSVDVQHGSGYGAEPNGKWIESIEKYVDCSECEYDRAHYRYKANCYMEPCNSFTCPNCGHETSSP